MISTMPPPVDPTPSRLRIKRKRRLTEAHWWLVAALLAVPALLVALKLSGSAPGEWLDRWVSLDHIPHEMRTRSRHLVIAPFGALIVVIVRQTLGVRVLGPFRSVLLAIAFEMTGATVGVVFFSVVVGVVVLLRPVYKRMKLPYFGRSAALLVSVAGIVVAAELLGHALGVRSVEHIAYFPIVVLTLAGSACASTLKREGPRSALWRASTTAGLAVLIVGLASVGVVERAVMRFPELILAEIAGVILVSELLSMRLLQHLNPPPVKKRKVVKSTNTGAPRTINLSKKPDTIPAQTPHAE